MGVGSSQLLPERDGRWHRWREDGKMRKGLWRPITSSQYALAFQQFGGSFAVHPDVVSLVSDFAARPVDYRGLFHGPDLVAALPLWGRHVVGAAWTLARYRVADQFDGGDPELILPIAPDVQIHLPCCARYISPLQQPRITNLAPESTALTIAREMGAGTAPLPSRGLRQRRREARAIEAAGGTFVPIAPMAPSVVAEAFVHLYRARRGCAPIGAERLGETFRRLGHMLAGDVLMIGGDPAAIEIMYRHEAPDYLFVNGVQRAYDPRFEALSVGSALALHNLVCVQDEAASLGKPLRYNVGFGGVAYKKAWASEMPCYRVNSAAMTWDRAIMRARRALAG